MENDESRDDLSSWVVSRVEEWEQYRDNNYKDKWDEYYRLWRGVWTEADKSRQSERSKLISPATQQAVEATVSELEEATFGRGRWIDVSDDLQDQDKNDVAMALRQLLEDFELAQVPSAVAETYLNGALYGTGIAKIVVDVDNVPQVETEEIPGTLPTLSLFVRFAGSLLDARRALQQHCGRRRLRDEGEGTVDIHRDDDRNDQALLPLGLCIEGLTELHDVHTALSEGGPHGRAGIGLAGRNLQLDLCDDLLHVARPPKSWLRFFDLHEIEFHGRGAPKDADQNAKLPLVGFDFLHHAVEVGERAVDLLYALPGFEQDLGLRSYGPIRHLAGDGAHLVLGNRGWVRRVARFCRATLRLDALPILDANAKKLTDEGTKRILLEGRGDEIGTSANNLVLGERRAKAVRSYLKQLGLVMDLRTTSYGKDRPLCFEHQQECWQKNRSVHFVVKE